MSPRKWLSNSAKVLAAIPTELLAKRVDIVAGSLPATKTPGVMWQAQEDQFSFCIASPTKPCTTKREFLSRLASVFDPLGLFPQLSCVVVFCCKRSGWLAPTGVSAYL
eukprot:scpid113027/ scgid29779/ 